MRWLACACGKSPILTPGTYNLNLTGNLISSGTSYSGVAITFPCYSCSVVGNNISQVSASLSTAKGVFVDAACNPCVISGNTFGLISDGIWLGANASGSISVPSENSYSTVTTPFTILTTSSSIYPGTPQIIGGNAATAIAPGATAYFLNGQNAAENLVYNLAPRSGAFKNLDIKSKHIAWGRVHPYVCFARE